MKKLLLVGTALMLSAPAFATDGFGDRFGSNAPYALSDGMDDVVADTQGFGMDDMNDPSALNRIDPAAGEEDAQAQEAVLEGDADTQEDVKPAEIQDENMAGEVDTATDVKPQSEEAGSAEIEPAAGAETAKALEGEADTEANADADTSVDVEKAEEN